MVFVILSIVTFLPWIISGTSFVWATDGREQHFPALVYIGKMLREFIRSILSGSPQFKMWDLNIGLGSDVISTLNYYGLGDPLNLLSVFVPARYTEYLYDFLIILRIYLAGISFSIFCFYKKTNRNGAFIGYFIYAFSGFVLTYGIKHPFFINPLIYFPLLLLGLDKLLKKKSLSFLPLWLQ